MKDANNILEFLASEGYLTFHEDSKVATSDLYAANKVRLHEGRKHSS